MEQLQTCITIAAFRKNYHEILNWQLIMLTKNSEISVKSGWLGSVQPRSDSQEKHTRTSDASIQNGYKRA
jgi:hypothetical protein